MNSVEIRNCELSDVDELIELENKCWDFHLCANKNIIMDRINNYKEVFLINIIIL